MAAEGDDLNIQAEIPDFKGETLTIGKLDGKSRDVTGQGRALNLSPYWHYFGHKYNREWVRVLSSAKAVEVKMILLKDVEDGILTMDPAPKVTGKVLSWKIPKGGKIRFYDGRAKMSIRRMNSYIDVDQIIFRRLD